MTALAGWQGRVASRCGASATEAVRNVFEAAINDACATIEQLVYTGVDATEALHVACYGVLRAMAHDCDVDLETMISAATGIGAAARVLKDADR